MSRVTQILKAVCPNCDKGKIFKKSHFFSAGKMHSNCPNCNHKFEKEPGFFFGAMYVSYGLNVAELIFGYFLLRPFFSESFDVQMIPFLFGIILLLFPFNFRLARIIWIYMFTKKK